MTYEDLLIAVNEYAAEKPWNSIRLLIHLIATGITDGSNVVRTSSLCLTKELRMSRDLVRSAILALTDVMVIECIPNVGFTFTMPPDWFATQRSLWAAAGSVENRARLTRIQAIGRLEPRQQVDEKPGNQSPGNQATLTRNQATVAWEPGNPDEKPGNSRLEPRQPATQNQQLSGHATHRSIDPSSVLPESSVDRIDQICSAVALSREQHSDAQMLSEHLRGYMAEFGPHGLAAESPDERILARCLACASLGELISLLRKMHSKGVRAGDGYAWFVTVFAHQLAGIRAEQLRAAMRAKYHRKPAQRSSNPLFGPQLVQQASAGVRHF